MKKAKLLFVLLLIQVSMFAQYSLYEMVLYYPVEKAISEDTIYDISGYRTHGILHNVNLTTDRNGNENSAISFNGINSYIEMGCPYFSEPEYCYSLWAKVYSNPPYGSSQTLISIGTDYGVDHFLMNTNHYSANDHLGWLGGGYHEDQSHAFVRLQTLSNEGEWVHLTYLRNSEILKLFVNGEYAASSTENVQTPYFGDDFIGNIGRRVNGIQYYYGAMDDIRIYERMLEPNEIMQAYEQEGIPQPIVDAGLDQSFSSSTSSIQLLADAKLYSSLTWSTSGDGFFSDPNSENSEYYPGIEDLNSEVTNLILTCEGYSGNSEIYYDTVQLINTTSGMYPNVTGRDLRVFPNPISNSHSLIIESSSVSLSKVKEVSLINSLGKFVKVSEPTVINKFSISVICDNLQNGIYFLTIDGIQTSKKVVVAN